MKIRLQLAIAACTLLGAWGCATDTQKQPSIPNDSTAATISAPTSSLRPGFQKKAFTIGHPINGVPSTEWELYAAWVYDDQGHLIEYADYFSPLQERITTYYDALGHDTLQVRTTANANDRVELRSRWNADFTSKTTEEYSHLDGRLVATTVETFTPTAKLLTEDIVDDHVVDMTQKFGRRLVYDAQDRLVEEHDIIHGKDILGARHHYDSNGNCIKIERNDAEGNPSQITTYSYDASHQKRDRHLQEFGTYVLTNQLQAEYAYDTDGRLMQVTHYAGQCDAQGKQSGRCTISETIHFTYNAQGLLQMEDREAANATPKKMRKRFEYEGKMPSNLQEVSAHLQD